MNFTGKKEKSPPMKIRETAPVSGTRKLLVRCSIFRCELAVSFRVGCFLHETNATMKQCDLLVFHKASWHIDPAPGAVARSGSHATGAQLSIGRVTCEA